MCVFWTSWTWVASETNLDFGHYIYVTCVITEVRLAGLIVRLGAFNEMATYIQLIEAHTVVITKTTLLVIH